MTIESPGGPHAEPFGEEIPDIELVLPAEPIEETLEKLTPQSPLTELKFKIEQQQQRLASLKQRREKSQEENIQKALDAQIKLIEADLEALKEQLSKTEEQELERKKELFS